MLKEIVHYCSDTEPTREEIQDLKDKSLSENKIFFVEYYCEYKDQITTLESHDGNLSIYRSDICQKQNMAPSISREELARLCKELRDMTGEGLMTCKAALFNNNFNLEAAKQWLQEKGLAKV